jgi:hypothetical protein
MRSATLGTVLIGFAESLAAIESAWILLDAGFDVAAFSVDPARAALKHSARVRLHAVTDPEVDADAAVREILVLANRVGACAVLPLDDEALWLCDAAARKGMISPVAGPTGEQAELAIDKARQFELALDAGLLVPPTVVYDPSRQRADSLSGWLPASSEGQLMVKSALAVALNGTGLVPGSGYVANDESRALELLHDAEGPVLVQPRLRGTGEGLFGFVGPDGVLAWSAHRRIRMMNPNGSGSSACRSIDPDPQLIVAAEKFLSSSGWRGIFMLEFLRDTDGRPWFMELNGRPWGSMALARHRNLAYPAWAVRAAMDPDFVPPDVAAAPHVTARHLGREILHVLFAIRGRKAGGPEWPRVIPTLRAVLRWHRGDVWYNAKRGELRVFAFDTKASVMSRFRRR